MVNNKTTVMSVFKLLDEYKDYLLSEVMNTIYQLDSILKKNTETLWQTVDIESVFKLLDEYKDYLLSREVK